MTADELLTVFDGAAKAARTAVEPLSGAARRERTDRLGQYALDLVADAAVLPILHKIGLAVVSEESGRSGHDDAPITVVLDPVDGSTNCSRHPVLVHLAVCRRCRRAALRPRHEPGHRRAYNRARRQGVEGRRETRAVDRTPGRGCGDRVLGDAPTAIAVEAAPILGSAALELGDVASGALDAYLSSWLSPWDYLGGLLVSRSRRAGRRRARQCARRHRSQGAATARGGGDHRAARRSAPGPPS